MRLIEDMVWEILVLLPTSSLMMSKFVSKLWYSIIRNPRFAKQHSRLSGPYRGLVVTNFDNTPYLYVPYAPLTVFYAYVTGDPVRTMIAPHLSLDLRNFNRITRFVKGLVCYGKDNTFVLCNVATQERVNLPPTPAPVGLQNLYCHLGYDPVDEIYKVLVVYATFKNENTFAGCGNSQIFSIGEGSNPGWRSIAPAPIHSECQSLCINGTLYWLQPPWSRLGPAIVAFHLNTETFEMIYIPVSLYRSVDLAEIDGNLALISYKDDYVGSDDHPVQKMSVYRMHNDCTGGPPRWYEQKAEVRIPWRHADMNQDQIEAALFLTYGGTMQTGSLAGKILLTPYMFEHYPVPIYVYDHVTNRTSCFMLDGCLPFNRDLVRNETFLICNHEEDLIPLSHFVR